MQLIDGAAPQAGEFSFVREVEAPVQSGPASAGYWAGVEVDAVVEAVVVAVEVAAGGGIRRATRNFHFANLRCGQAALARRIGGPTNGVARVGGAVDPTAVVRRCDGLSSYMPHTLVILKVCSLGIYFRACLPPPGEKGE